MPSLRAVGLQFQEYGPYHFELKSGSCTSLSGASGAGKTRLLRALADLDDHTGEVFFDEVECRTLSAPQWRRQVGLLPAEILWWYPTVGEHFGQVQTALLTTVGFDLDVLKWQVSRLSMGERQRLGVIRMLSNHPGVLLLDEPTSNLDAHNTDIIEKLIDEYRNTNHAAVLWVSHGAAQRGRVASKHLHLENKLLSEY
jgi:ABC-type iron transport system FetAB ATPase subunit